MREFELITLHSITFSFIFHLVCIYFFPHNNNIYIYISAVPKVLCHFQAKLSSKARETSSLSASANLHQLRDVDHDEINDVLIICERIWSKHGVMAAYVIIVVLACGT